MENSIISPEYLLPSVDTQLSPNISDLFKKGMQDYRHQDYNGAIEVFQSILSTNPNMPEAQVNLGNAYFHFERIEEAIACWKKALNLDSTQVSCYLNIGNGYYKNNNVPEAIKHWLVAVTMAPDLTTAHINLGSAYEKLGDLSQAFVYYEEYLKYQKKDKSPEYQKIYSKVTQSKKVALHNLEAGFYYQKRNKLRKAAMCYLRSVKSYPNFPKAHLNMGSICYLAKKYEHAIKFWLQAVKLDPTYDNTYCNLGVAYDILKKYDLAYCMYNRFILMSNKGSFQIEERVKTLAKYLEKHPEGINKHLEKAEELYAKLKYADSLWLYENYVILKPDKKDSLLPRITELKASINPAIKAANTAFKIGNTCYDQGNYDKATHAFRRCLLLNPEGENSKLAHKKISDCAKQLGKNLNGLK